LVRGGPPHVVQQREGSVDGTPREGGISVSDPGDKFEQEAEANADVVMSAAGDHAGHDTAAPAAAAVQREADEEGPPVQTMRDDTAVQREAEGPEEESEELQALHDDTAVQREAEGPEEEGEELQALHDDTAVQREEEQEDEGEG
jgi:hypothetical protein